MALLNYAPPTSPYLQILYRDDDLLVLNKPSGLLSVPGKAAEHKDSLQLRIQRVYPTATVVHRLDMATSGIMLFALNKSSHRHISKQFELREVGKRYFARVYGRVEEDEGKIEQPLICDWPNRPKQMIDHERGKHALTYYKVLARNEFSSLLELIPHTGRSHQLRVHTLHLGHPILGDRLYATGKALTCSPRLLLHAESICFTHPTTDAKMQFSVPHQFDEEPSLVLL